LSGSLAALRPSLITLRREAAQSAAVLCGGSNRWDVKTLSDLRGPNAPKLKRNAVRRTIHYLVTQEHEAIGKHTARLAGVETKYVLTNVVRVEAKVEQDQDVQQRLEHLGAVRVVLDELRSDGSRQHGPMEPSSRLRSYDGYRDVPPHQCKAYRSGTRSAMPFKHEEI
jgi:hypothetical protein